MITNATNIRSYTELSKLKTFDERFRYLMLNGCVGKSTFGFDRILNQKFYKDKIWKQIRNEVIVRDHGCDLGVDDYIIHNEILIHHMNPITEEDILNRTEFLLNPEYLISVSLQTHNAIHYGSIDYINNMEIIVRRPNDTCPWKDVK